MEKIKNGRRGTYVFLLLSVGGLLAGGVCGLLGAGGGIVAVFFLGLALKGSSAERRDLLANSLCVMLPLAALSCLLYARTGNLSAEGMEKYFLPALLGGALGGLLLGRLNATLLRRLFGGLVIWSGVLLLIR